jgi:hypothetical protein
MRKIIVAIFIVISFLLSSCDTNGGTVDLTVNETNAEVTEVTDEIIHMNNCGGKAETEQVAEKSKTIHIEGGGNLGVDAALVNGEVSAKYGEVNGVSKSIKLVAPLGTNMEFTIRWTEKTWIGFVTSQSQASQANYKVSVPISVELVSNQDLGCSQNSDIVPVNTLPAVATDIPIVPTSQQVLPTSISKVSIQGNVLQNGTFENIGGDGLPTGWEYVQRHKAGLDTTSIVGYEGKAFCSRQNLAESESKGWVGFGQDIPVQAGQNYGFGGWVYLQNAIAFHVHIEWYDSNGQFLGWDQFTQAYGYPPNGETTNGWIYIQGSKVVPSNATKLKLGLWHGVVNDTVNAPGSFFCADNLELGLLK